MKQVRIFIVTIVIPMVGGALLFCTTESHGQEVAATLQAPTGVAKGTRELSLMTGYTYNFRRTDAQVTKLRGVPVILGGGVVATDATGTSWYRGQVTLGGELQFTQYVELLSTYLVALTPTVKYTFLASERLRPYVEAGAGVVWTDLGDRIPEKGSQFNFNLQLGAGLSYFVAPTASINVSYRLQHVSNAGTAKPNHGIDAGEVLIGISKFF
jgi:opacity protein-like surface antigen